MTLASRREALRKLAERPGTEHEGAVAREMLRRLDERSRSGIPADEREPFELYAAYNRREMSVTEFAEALEAWSRGNPWKCPCGHSFIGNVKCQNWERHLEIQTEIRAKFRKGDRVLYNYHAYPTDCPGRVAAYVPLKPENGTYPWCWISIKFDHLKGARQVPIYSAEGWHLKHAVTEQVEV